MQDEVIPISPVDVPEPLLFEVQALDGYCRPTEDSGRLDWEVDSV